MPIATFGGSRYLVDQVVLQAPPDFTITIFPFSLQWGTTSKTGREGPVSTGVHFEILITRDDLVSFPILSHIQFSMFQFFNGTTWQALSSNGLAHVDLGRQVRVNLDGVGAFWQIDHSYTWQVRQYEFI